MKNKKQFLSEEIKKQTKVIEEEIKKSDDEIEIWESKIKVENKMFKMRDLPRGIKEDVSYSIQGLESMLIMEKNKNAELKKELEILKYRSEVIMQFQEIDL